MQKILIMLLACVCPSLMAVQVKKINANTYKISNDLIARTLSTSDGLLQTAVISNKLANKELIPLSCDEFRLRFSKGTHINGTDFVLTAKDFKVTASKEGENSLTFSLKNDQHGIGVDVTYSIEDNNFFMHKQLKITATERICLERIDIDVIAFDDSYQPYTIRQIDTRGIKKTPNGKWRPGLGQPLFTKKTATFWGTEFPASYNFVEEGKLVCGYLSGRYISPQQAHTSYKAVVGVSDDARYNSDAFYNYINKIRIRPLRLQMQYNSWFDYGQGVNRKSFIKSVNKVNDELCVKRGVSPFKAYVIDDGWQNSGAKSDWSEMVWTVNRKFDPKFTDSFNAVKNAKSDLGLWLSPGCNFGAKRIVPQLRQKGYGGLTNWMSLAETKYMDMLQKRMVNLTKEGVTYFKLDGTFGHLYIRDFDFNPENGVPGLPQELNIPNLRADDNRLNTPQYDEYKSYYLTVGTERLMKIFQAMHKANPEVYIVISNGAYLSPWWMMHCDASWMINAGDAAKGAGRTGELVYRDAVYHEIWKEEKTHFPMNSLFNHEPKKTSSKEDAATFRDYLYMNMSRGTGFVELYIKTFTLGAKEWDVLAEGLHWVEDVFPTFDRARMHGGSPKAGDIYGFTGWNKTRGYISLHNPSKETKKYTIELNRDFGLIPGQTQYLISSPLQGSLKGLPQNCNYGDSLTVSMAPGEVRIINFDNKLRSWKKEKELQTQAEANSK